MLEIIILVAGVLNLAMGIIVLLGHGEKGRGKLSFALFSIVTFGWALCVFLIHRTNYTFFVPLSYSIASLCVTFLSAWTYFFSLETCRWKFRPFLIYTLGLIFTIMPLIDGLVVFNVHENPAGEVISENGPLYLLYTCFFVFTYLFVLWSLVNLYRLSLAEKKSQARIILAGFSIHGILVILFGLILPIFNYDKLIDFDVPSSLIFIAFTSYAIVKYRWMNIKVIAVQLFTLLIMGVALMDVLNSNTFSDRIYHIFAFTVLALLSYLLVRDAVNEYKQKEVLRIMAADLTVANDKLRELDKTKTEFISIASHQLRTPITAIKGFASLLMEGTYGKFSKSAHEALEKVFISSAQLINLIEDLLNVSKMELGRLTFTFESASVEKILKELFGNFQLVARAKKLSLILKLPAKPLPDIKMDAGKIRELVSNFIDNALKYTERGGVTVSEELREEGVVIDGNGFVKADEKSPYGKVVRITVSDTGIGIPKEEIPYLFKKFSRGKDESRLHVSGTGLGLYVGKAIADAHHGQTWVESDGVGKGSRFIIEIPVDAQ